MEPSKEKLTCHSILRWLRSLGLTYGEASELLRGAIQTLESIKKCEVEDLPIADGLFDAFDPEKLILSSTGKPFRQICPPPKKREIFFVSPAKCPSDDG